jgi:hypothetical protein
MRIILGKYMIMGEYEATGQRPTEHAAPYRFQGMFYEACDCYTICPCWTGGAPDDGYCTGLFAWLVEAGTIAGVDVAGRHAVSVSRHAGSREGGRQQVFFFVDQNATPEQSEALVGALTGAYGGPLAELGRLLGDFMGVEAANIQLEHRGRRSLLSVGQRVQVEATARMGPAGKITTLADAQLSEVLGTPAEVGTTERFRIGLPEHGLDIDIQGRSATRGWFTYAHATIGDAG